MPKKMSWTLYPQYKKGKKIEKPKGIPGVILSSDATGFHIYAFDEMRNKSELWRYTAIWSRDGILIEGYEREGPTTPAYLQCWWVVPDFPEATGEEK